LTPPDPQFDQALRRVAVYNKLFGLAMEFAGSFATVVSIAALSTGPADRVAVFRLIGEAHSSGLPDIARTRFENILRQAHAEEDDPPESKARMRETLDHLRIPLTVEPSKTAQ
jgi:hypothetical protein